LGKRGRERGGGSGAKLSFFLPSTEQRREGGGSGAADRGGQGRGEMARGMRGFDPPPHLEQRWREEAWPRRPAGGGWQRRCGAREGAGITEWLSELGDGDRQQLGAPFYRRATASCASAPSTTFNGGVVAVRPLASAEVTAA